MVLQLPGSPAGDPPPDKEGGPKYREVVYVDQLTLDQKMRN